MTTLSVMIHGRYLHGDTPEQVDALIDEVLTSLDGGNPWKDLDSGEVADLYFASTPLTEDTFAEPPFEWRPDHQLTVAINKTTGFGALRFDTRWVSLNSSPPRDPAVIGDPYVPYWYRPQYTVPITEVEAGLREFSRSLGERRSDALRWVEHGGDQHTLYFTLDEYRSLVHAAA